MGGRADTLATIGVVVVTLEEFSVRSDAMPESISGYDLARQKISDLRAAYFNPWMGS